MTKHVPCSLKIRIVFLNNGCFYGIKCLYPLNLISKRIDIVYKSGIIWGIIAAETFFYHFGEIFFIVFLPVKAGTLHVAFVCRDANL